MRIHRPILLLILMLQAAAVSAAPAPPANTPAVAGVLAAFDHADIVTLGERPWSKLDSDFRCALVSDPSFPDKVDDIVVSFGNSRHQDLLDAYLLDLKPVPRDTLSKVWEDCGIPGAWDSPVYSYFIDCVRRANQKRVRDQRVRVLAGDPPYDWSTIRSMEDIKAYGPPGTFVLDLVEREVVAKKRKALMIYPARNFFRRDRGLGPKENLTLSLEAQHPQLRVYVVGTAPEHSTAIDSLTSLSGFPVLLRLEKSRMGQWPATRVFDFGEGLLQGMADALIYYGPRLDQLERPNSTVFRKKGYSAEVVRRKGLLNL
jgi:hypothetical protein